MYNTTIISPSNIQHIGNARISDTLSATNITSSNVGIQGNITASGTVNSLSVSSDTLAYRGQPVITYTGSLPNLGMTINASTRITGNLILDQPLIVDSIDINNVTFRCNVSYPSLELETSSSPFHTFSIVHNPLTQLFGCNLVNISIGNPNTCNYSEIPPALMMNTLGNIGVNTSSPMAIIDVQVACNTSSNIASFMNPQTQQMVTIDNNARVGISTTLPQHQLHVANSNTLAPFYYPPSDPFNLYPLELPPLVGLYTSSCNNVYSPLLSGFSNGEMVYAIDSDGTTTINSSLTVSGAVNTATLVTSEITAPVGSPIDCGNSILCNILNMNATNMNITNSLSSLNCFANVLTACNLVFPGLNISEFNTQFQADSVSFTGAQMNIGAIGGTDASLLRQPLASRKMMIAMDDVNGTSVALGVIGNDSGRNTIRITSGMPAMELFSTANGFIQKSATGVDLSGFYISYTNIDTNDADELNTRKQVQISPYGVRLGRTMQIVPTTIMGNTPISTSNIGCVGIGLNTSTNDANITLPKYKLHLQGSMWVQSGSIPSTSNTDPLFFINDSTGRVGIRTNSAQRDLHVNGSMYAQSVETTLPVITSSDARLKTNIHTITDALTKIKQLNGYIFTRSKTGTQETGLIAQEVKQVIPEAVHTDELDGTLGVAYGNLVGLLVEGIKELSDKLDRSNGGA
jgi:hypothetical protein